MCLELIILSSVTLETQWILTQPSSSLDDLFADVDIRILHDGTESVSESSRLITGTMHQSSSMFDLMLTCKLYDGENNSVCFL
jgi:hypothetical protein